jgi:hypothetical protein
MNAHGAVDCNRGDSGREINFERLLQLIGNGSAQMEEI